MKIEKLNINTHEWELKMEGNCLIRIVLSNGNKIGLDEVDNALVLNGSKVINIQPDSSNQIKIILTDDYK